MPKATMYSNNIFRLAIAGKVDAFIGTYAGDAAHVPALFGFAWWVDMSDDFMAHGL